MKTTTFLIAAATTTSVQAFTTLPNNARLSTTTALQMGLFDGVKEAFGADGMGELDGDRETPIDRWMGWNAKGGEEQKVAVGSKTPTDFVDSMDTKNYITVSSPNQWELSLKKTIPPTAASSPSKSPTDPPLQKTVQSNRAINWWLWERRK
eukprot:g3646.t1.1.5e174189 g3646  g3646.t1 contig12:2487179-2487774(-)